MPIEAATVIPQYFDNQFPACLTIVWVLILLLFFLGSQMIVTYLSEESERANVIARLGFSYGIGMVVGPTLGGFITSNFE